MNNVIDFINVNRERYLDELKALLAIPSISALPEHAGDVRRCADWCADEMRRVGLQNVQLFETPGNPIVYGDWLRAQGALLLGPRAGGRAYDEGRRSRPGATLGACPRTIWPPPFPIC